MGSGYFGEFKNGFNYIRNYDYRLWFLRRAVVYSLGNYESVFYFAGEAIMFGEQDHYGNYGWEPDEWDI